MSLLSSGNVGIGKTDPSVALDVAGDAAISSDLTVSGNQHLVGELYMSGRLRLEREDNPSGAERTWMIYTDDASSNHLTFDYYASATNIEPNFGNVTATSGQVMQLRSDSILLNENTNVENINWKCKCIRKYNYELC